MKIKLETPIKVSEITASTDASVSGIHEFAIDKICTDSNEAEPGCLFIALRGKSADGNDFIPLAKETGAITLGTSPLSDLTVMDTETALLRLARYYKENHLKSIKRTVGITGSVGKTTTKNFLHKLLKQRHKTHASCKNFNNTLGLPLTVLSAPRETEILICELGMNSPGEIERLSSCIRPDVAIITNVGTAHIGRLGSREKIAAAKLEILSGMSQSASLFVPFGEELLNKYGKTFSTDSLKADLAVIGEEHLKIFLNSRKIGEAEFTLPGYHHRECLAAALAAGLCIDSPDEIIPEIPKIEDTDVRERIYKLRNFYVLDDAYNASYESISAAMFRLNSLSGYKGKCVLLADVLELGEFSAEIHIKIGRLAARFSPDRMFLYGEYAKFTAAGAESVGMPGYKIHVFETGQEHELAEKIKCLNRDDEIMLVKGSHGMHLEKIIEYINP